MKSLFFLFWMMFSCALGTIYGLFKWGNLNVTRDSARFFGKFVLRVFRIHLEVEGIEHLESHQPCIYIANHQSVLDVALFGSIFPSRTVVIGKRELLWVPFFGLFFVVGQNILINRKKKGDSLCRLNKAVQAIQKKKISILIFPEGTRNRSFTGILPLKKGAFHMAIQARVPVIPIIAESLKPFFTKQLKSCVIKVRILPPISIKDVDFDKVSEFSEKTREIMLKNFQELSTHSSY